MHLVFESIIEDVQAESDRIVNELGVELQDIIDAIMEHPLNNR